MAGSRKVSSEEDFLKLLENDGSKKSEPLKLSGKAGLVIGCGALAITAVTFPFIMPFFRRVCLPYVPATTEQIKNVVEALKGSSGKVVDLGSGDGRVVIAAAKNNFLATGVEINPVLALYSRFASIRAGVYPKVNFHICDLWKFNLKPYNNVVVFGVETMMEEIEKKFFQELEKDAQIIVCRFPLPGVKPIKKIGYGFDQVWIYKKN